MQTSDPAKLVEAMLGDEGMPDPKQIALDTHNDSELFDEFMRNYVKACRDLYAQAKSSGALAGDEPEGLVIRAVMQIAVKNFAGWTPGCRAMLQNLERFI